MAAAIAASSRSRFRSGNSRAGPTYPLGRQHRGEYDDGGRHDAGPRCIRRVQYLLRGCGLRQVVTCPGTVSSTLSRLVAPERLDSECAAAVALDVVQGPRDRRHGRLAGSAETLAHPRALVTVLVGIDRVVPAAEVGRA